MVTIYISSAGATNAVNVIRALEQSSLDVRLVGGDMNNMSAGLFLVNKGYVVPRADDPAFIPTVIEICQKEKVDVALPIYSAEFPAFSRNLGIFEKFKVATYAPPERALRICMDKYQVANFLTSIDVPCPRTWDWSEAYRDWVVLPYPVFMKKRNGTGSKGARKIEGQTAMEFFLNRSKNAVVQEFIGGEEFTVDVLSDLSGRMIAASPRRRDRIYGGLSVCGTTVKDPEILEYTRRIVEKLRIPGPSNVQCIRNEDGELYFTDINPRFASGGLPLAVAAGVNSPELLVRMLMGEEIPRSIEARAGVSMIRYWDSVIVRKP